MKALVRCAICKHEGTLRAELFEPKMKCPSCGARGAVRKLAEGGGWDGAGPIVDATDRPSGPPRTEMGRRLRALAEARRVSRDPLPYP